ncbi:MAG: S-layer homology domain-containing protein [Andreesenia angusta]|nr:S-layer homology domain-containing protein [Andreesenia angusta]
MKYRRYLLLIVIIALLTGCSSNKTIKKINSRLNNGFKEKHWAEDYMNNLIDSEIFTGYPDGDLRLDKSMTRAEVAAIIYNLTGEIEPINNNFNDIDTDDWYYNPINSIKEQGLINGYEDGGFHPNEDITREDFAILAYNYLYKNIKNLDEDFILYSDTEGIKGEKEIGVLSALGLIDGYEDKKFHPNDPISRGQVAKVISLLKNYIVSLQEIEGKGIYDELQKGFNEFNPIFSFKYNEKLTPQEVVDIYKENFLGTYFEGIIGSLGVEVRTLLNKSEVFIKADFLHDRNAEKEIDRFVKENADIILRDYDNDIDRIKAAHDLIVTTAKYSDGDDNRLNEKGINVHSPYSIVSSGEGVCQAYALLNYRLLKELGYNALYVIGEAHNKNYDGPHAWNLVQIGQNWYHIDTTWDDPVPDIFNTIRYDYFLLTDMEIGKDHDWDLNKYPNALVEID